MISFMKYGTTTGKVAAQVDARLLLHDLDAQVALARIVRVNHRADAVLELRNHLAAAVVGRRIRREQNQHVDIELDRIAANLHVAFFENVEQADLHQFVQFRQFVHRKDAAMHARNQPEVQRLFGRHAHAAGQLGRIDFANDVGELRARRKPLRVAILTRPPGDRHVSSANASPRTRCTTRVIGCYGSSCSGTPGMSR